MEKEDCLRELDGSAPTGIGYACKVFDERPKRDVAV